MKKKLLELLRQQVSYNQAERRWRDGWISYEVFWAYDAVWRWIAPRMGGEAGRKHDRFYERYGKVKYYARINKVRAAFGCEPLTFPPGFLDS